MEDVCPLCNALTSYVIYCERCNGTMKDGGRIQDFYDDYSPYLSYALTNLMDGEPKNICQHLFTCKNCSSDKVINVRNIII